MSVIGLVILPFFYYFFRDVFSTPGGPDMRVSLSCWRWEGGTLPIRVILPEPPGVRAADASQSSPSF